MLGFLLSSVLSDYKEAKRMPPETRVSFEAIHAEVARFAEADGKIDIQACRMVLKNIVYLFDKLLDHANGHRNLIPVLEEVDQLGGVFAQLEHIGVPGNLHCALANCARLASAEPAAYLSHPE